MSYAGSISIFSQTVMRSALVMTLGLESIIISQMTFTSQDDARAMAVVVQAMFEAAKEIGIDTVDAGVYQDFIAMGGAIMNHLATTALQLPRYMTFTAGAPMPTLYLANRIYADASRFIEIEQENKIVNPAFAPINLRVLSNAGY